MKKNIIENVMANHSGLGEFVNGMEFVKEVHSLYKNLGGMKNYQIAKGIIKYVANENELGWNYVVMFLGYLFENIDKEGITACKESIDWKSACKKCYPKELDKVKTKVAFKDLFYLIALNNDEDIDNLLAESTLSAYGWHKIVKRIVAIYEEILSTSILFVEPTVEDAESPTEVKVETEILDTPVVVKKVTTASSIPTTVESEEHTDTPKPVPHKKYARGRTIILKCPDGTVSEWANVKAIKDAVGIPEGAVRKNLSGHSASMRFNRKKYIASYKEAC